MNNTIDSFRGEYFWLSNFYFCHVIYDHEIYVSVEHAFQAAKTLDLEERKNIRKASTPSLAKKIGKTVKLIKDWENVKLDIMKELIHCKFGITELMIKLLNTEDKILIEGNTWGDKFWGICNGEGENNLGKILMEERKWLKEHITCVKCKDKDICQWSFDFYNTDGDCLAVK